MRGILSLLLFICVYHVNAQRAIFSDVVEPINVDVKDEQNGITLCHDSLETVAYASVKLKVSNNLAITSAELIGLRYYIFDADSNTRQFHEVAFKEGYTGYFESTDFKERISVTLVDKSFSDFPFTAIYVFKVSLSPCN